MKTTLTLLVFVAFVLVSASLQSNASRPKYDRGLVVRDFDRSGRFPRTPNDVPTAAVDSKDTKVDTVSDQSKGSGETKESTGDSSTSTSTDAKTNDEDDVNPTYKHYGGTGSKSDSSTDTHRYYSVDDRTGSSSNDDGRKPQN